MLFAKLLSAYFAVTTRVGWDELFEFVDKAHRNGGAVTLNVGIYENGSMAEPSVAQVVDLPERLRTS